MEHQPQNVVVEGNCGITIPVIPVEVKILDEAFWAGHDICNYATPGSAAFDLRANISEPVTLLPGQTMMIGTGLALWIKDRGYALYILPRSGLGNKGLILGNGTGLIDSDYQGELKISAYNRLPQMLKNGDWDFVMAEESNSITINPGDRIAQAVIGPVIQMTPVIVKEFSNQSERGDGGFGSSGVA